MIGNTRSLYSLALAATILTPVNGLWAQSVSKSVQSAGSEDTASAAGPVDAGNDIIVTAQKRSERLVDVPIAITAVTADDIKSSGVTSAQMLGQLVPAMRMDYAGANSQPTVRAVGSALAGPGTSSAVAIYIDGIYQPNVLTNSFELADIESVQVLKGPQGTLFGRNATGGAVVVTTAKPSFEPHARGSISYGRFNDVRALTTASTGLSDKIAVSLSGLYHDSDGFVKDVNTGQDKGKTHSYLLRGRMLFNATENLSFLLTAQHSYTRDDTTVAFSALGGRSAVLGFGIPVVVPSRRGDVSLDSPTKFFSRETSANLRTDLELDFATLTSYTAYQKSHSYQSLDFDATSVPLLGGDFPTNDKNFSQELDLVSAPGNKLSWTTGLYYFHQSNGQPAYHAYGLGVIPTSPTTVLTLYNNNAKTDAYALFADVTYEALPKLFFTLGGRYSSELDSRRYTPLPFNVDYNASKRFNSFTPRAVVRYEVAPRSSIYASFSKGFKSGGFIPTSTSSEVIRPEKLTAYEIGMKTARGTVHAELSGFYYDYTDLQVSSYDTGVAIVRNAAKSRIYGGEMQLSWNPSSRFHIDASGAYTHSEYRKFLAAPTYLGTGTAADPIVVGTADISGNVMQRAPKLTGTISTTYNQPVGDGTLRFYASYYRTSRFNMDPPGQFPQKGYGLLSARMTFLTAGDKFSIGVFGTNLTDETYLSQVLPFSGAILQQYGLPRSYGVEVGFKF